MSAKCCGNLFKTKGLIRKLFLYKISNLCVSVLGFEDDFFNIAVHQWGSTISVKNIEESHLQITFLTCVIE